MQTKIEPQDKQAIIDEVENSIGGFSFYNTTVGKAEKIPFAKRPAQKFLDKLGVPSDDEAKLSHLSFKKDGSPISTEANTDITIHSTIGENAGELTITGERITRLVKSAQTYVNTDVLPQGTYAQLLKSIDLPNGKDAQTGIHFHNLAVGVCHAQEIEMLVEHTIADGEAVAGPRTGTIKVNDPAMVLLSTPALNCGRYDGAHARLLPDYQKKFLANAMYSVICHAAKAKECEALTLTAAGLGVFEGNPDDYYQALFEQSLKYPDLYIFYNPGKYPKHFGEKLSEFTKNNPTTKLRATTKDVVYLADELSKKGIRTACHNPSDPKVVYAQYDIGKHWKTGCNGDDFVGEEFDGAMSTAPVNSFSLNPPAYNNFVEVSFGQKFPLVSSTVAEPETPKDLLKGSATNVGDLVKVKKDSPSEKNSPVIETQKSMDGSFILNCLNQLQLSTGEKVGYAIFAVLLLASLATITFATCGVGLIGAAAAGITLTAGIAGASVGGAGLMITGGYSLFSRCKKEPEEVLPARELKIK